MEEIAYPRVRRNELLFDEYFGTKVPDPYRWLEECHSPEINAYIDAQIQLTKAFIERNEDRTKIANKLQLFSNYQQFTCPFKRGSTYFWCEKASDRKNSILYKSKDLLDNGTVLLNPDELGLDENVELASYSISPKGTYLCFELRNKKNEKSEFQFWRCDTGKPIGDLLTGLPLSSMTWTADERGLFYTICGIQEELSAQLQHVTRKRLCLRYHLLETDQNQDVLCYYWDGVIPIIFTELSHCGSYLLLSQFDTRRKQNLLYYSSISDIKKGESSLVPIIEELNARFTYVTNCDRKFIFLTNSNAPMNRLIQIDLDNAHWSEWKELIPHDPESKLEHVVVVNREFLIVNRLREGKSCLTIHRIDSGEQIRKVQIPIGRVSELTTDLASPQFFARFSSYNIPCQILEYTLQTNTQTESVFRQAEIVGCNSDDFLVKQIFFTSNDGTTIPMFLAHRKNLQLDATAPCKLTAFGGFGLINVPSFSANNLLFLRHFGGVLAVAGIRGGGEYGEKWHRAARGHIKQTSFDDLIAAAKYLLMNKYTCADRLFIEGRENGGLVVLASAIQRPDLFRAVVADNPVCDMLRFFTFSPMTRWLDEYGNPYHEELFRSLLSYSPVHNSHKLLTAGTQIPAFLIITDQKSSRVEPIHSFKIAASLQHETQHIHGPPVLNLIRNQPKTDLEQCCETWAIVQLYLSLKWVN